MIDNSFTIKKNIAEQIDKEDDLNYWLYKTVEDRFSAVFIFNSL